MLRSHNGNRGVNGDVEQREEEMILNERYELASLQWIKAFQRWVNMQCDPESLVGSFISQCVKARDGITASFEATDAPQHLLKDGRCGWTMTLKDGRIEIGDRPFDVADYRMIGDYKLLSEWMKFTDEEDFPFVVNEMPKLVNAGKIKMLHGSPQKVFALVELQWLMGWRNEFYSKYTY